MGVNDVALIGLEKTMEYVDLQLTRIEEKPRGHHLPHGHDSHPASCDNYDISNALIREFDGMLSLTPRNTVAISGQLQALADENGNFLTITVPTRLLPYTPASPAAPYGWNISTLAAIPDEE